MIITLDNTRRNTYATCPRKYYWRWEQHLDSKYGSSALRYGSVVHAGLECYYTLFKENKEIQIPDVMPAVIDTMKKEWEAESDGKMFFEDYRTFPAAVECVVSYLLHYTNEKQYLDILEVEDKFTVELPLDRTEVLWPKEVKDAVEKVEFIGRIDGVVNMNGLYAFEHKTTSLTIDQVSKTLHRTAQMIGYAWVIKQKYPDADVIGCMVNILQTKGGRARKDGSYPDPQFSFQRLPQLYVDHHYQGWLDSILVRAGQIAWSRITENWPQEFDGCYPYNSTCSFTSLCNQPRQLSAIDTSDFRTDHWDPRN